MKTEEQEVTITLGQYMEYMKLKEQAKTKIKIEEEPSIFDIFFGTNQDKTVSEIMQNLFKN